MIGETCDRAVSVQLSRCQTLTVFSAWQVQDCVLQALRHFLTGKMCLNSRARSGLDPFICKLLKYDTVSESHRHKISQRVSEHKGNLSWSLLVSLGNLITRTFCGHTDRLKRACACMNKTQTPQKGDYIRLCFFCDPSSAHLYKYHTVMESVGGEKKDKVQSLPLKNDHVHVWQCHDGTQKDLVYDWLQFLFSLLMVNCSSRPLKRAINLPISQAKGRISTESNTLCLETVEVLTCFIFAFIFANSLRTVLLYLTLWKGKAFSCQWI